MNSARLAASGDQARYTMRRPSDRNDGQKWPVSGFSAVVIPSGWPPSADTRNSPASEPKTMTPCVLQAPPLNVDTGAMSFGAPPDASTRFNRPPATNAMLRLSGDQNGCAASSVPPSLRNVVE